MSKHEQNKQLLLDRLEELGMSIESLDEGVRSQFESFISSHADELAALRSEVESAAETQANAVQRAAEISSEALRDHARSNQAAADTLGESIENAAGTIVGGLFATLFIGGAVALVAKAVSPRLEEIREINRKTALLNLVHDLEQHHFHPTFDFIRGSAVLAGYSFTEATELLSAFVATGILVRYRHGEIDALRIDTDSRALKDFSARHYNACIDLKALPSS
jgi:hypothetical protein